MPPHSPASPATIPARLGPYVGPLSTTERGSVGTARSLQAAVTESARSIRAPYAPGRAWTSAATAEALVAFPSAPAIQTSTAAHVADFAEASAPLPWITAFTEDSAEMVDAVIAPTDRALDEVSEPLFEEVVEAHVAPDAASLEGEHTPGVDVWPLDDAGERMRVLTSALDAHTSRNDASNAPVTQFDDEDPHPLPMPMWNDNDFVDVMPVHAASLPANVAAPASPISMSEFPHTPEVFRATDATGSAHGAADANEHLRFSSADATARALENLASRVRSGDLVIPGFSAELGDAAALAAALAALLAAGG